MAYSAGLMKDIVIILKPGVGTDGDYGRLPGTDSQSTRWAAIDWVRGTKALREGAVDAYDTIMVRMYYDPNITRDCKIRWNGATYKINSFHADQQENTIQITAQELVS